MFQQGLNGLGMMGQSGYAPYEQARRQQQAIDSLSQAAVEAQREDYKRAERAREAEIEKVEHNRKLLLLEE